MSQAEKLKKKAAEFEAKRQTDKAIATYLELFKAWESANAADIDVALYNRVGDMLVRAGNIGDAMSVWEKAVDHYSDGGFHNNAIALCNKILRNSPGRTSIYYKLGKASARKGLVSEARKNYLEYAERVQKTGQVDEAFRALKEFADLSPDNSDIRLMLADQLTKAGRKGEAVEQLQVLYERQETLGDTDAAAATLERMKVLDPAIEPRRGGSARALDTSALVFINIDDEPVRPRKSGAMPAPVPEPSPPPKAATPMGGLTFIDLDEPAKVVPKAAPASPPPEPIAIETVESAAALAADVAPPVPIVQDITFGASFGTEESATETAAIAPVADIEFTSIETPSDMQEVSSSLSSAEDSSFGTIDLEDGTPPFSGAHSMGVGDIELDAPETELGESSAPIELPLIDVGEALDPSEITVGRETVSAGGDIQFLDVSGAQAVVEPLVDILPEPDVFVAPPAPLRPTTPVMYADVMAAVIEADAAKAASANEPEAAEVSAGQDTAVVEQDSPVQASEEQAETAEPAAAAEAAIADTTDVAEGSPEEVAASDEETVATADEHSAVDEPVADTSAVNATVDPAETDVEEIAAATVEALDEEATPDGGGVGGTAGEYTPSPDGGGVGGTAGEYNPAPPEPVVEDIAIESVAVEAVAVEPAALEAVAVEAVAVEETVPEPTVETAVAEVAASDAAEAAQAADEAQPAAAEEPPRDAHRSTMSALAQSVDFLRARVDREPENWQFRRQLGEALLEDGDRAGGVDHLEAAMAGFENAGQLDPASSVADALIRLNPQSVRLQQKRVEYAYHMGDRPRLIEAYVELADLLFRQGETEKARAVYERVLTLAPDEPRAREALNTIAPAAPPMARRTTITTAAKATPPRATQRVTRATTSVPRSEATASVAPPAAPVSPPPAPPAAPPPTAPPARAKQPPQEEYVDLQDWLKEDEGPKSTRMVVEEKEPTGDENADFNEMLRKFKQGVAQNVDDEDHESHYDLGVAYKEMGLVDEAIGEFQKALRGPEHRARTYEALGQCFVEKNQPQVAITILQRALAEPGSSDDQLVGVLYLLGASAEALGQFPDAVKYYQRVFAVDINFRDVQARMRTIEKGAR